MFATHTVIVSLAAGIAVTLLASVIPAMRATRAAPIAAVREGATLPPSRFAHAKTLIVTAAGVAGAGLLRTGLFASGLATSVRLPLLAAGAPVLFLCLAFLSRWLVAPLAAALGRPFEAIAGAAGMLVPENSSRNPARTAVTAGALTVGRALVAFVATLGSGLRGTITDSIEQEMHADDVISADDASRPQLPPTRSMQGWESRQQHSGGPDPRLRPSASDQRHRPQNDHPLLRLHVDARLRVQLGRPALTVRRDPQRTLRDRSPPHDRQPLPRRYPIR